VLFVVSFNARVLFAKKKGFVRYINQPIASVWINFLVITKANYDSWLLGLQEHSVRFFFFERTA
jgi:hypothetical protein